MREKDYVVIVRFDKHDKDWLKNYAQKHRTDMNKVIRLLVQREQQRQRTGDDVLELIMQ